MVTSAHEIQKELQESIKVKESLLSSGLKTIEKIANLLIDALKNGNAVYLMGNGGSAADAQHIAGELVGRFKKDRRPLPVHSFTTDTSILTAIANDYGYDSCFSRQVDAFVKKGDIVFGLSTSGDSANVLKAVLLAKEKGAVTVGLTGENGGELKDAVDICLMVPSSSTPRIQECHITVGHILCFIVERELFT
ncbi:MAG TPA: D-sedoheptulose-7-phosphate isomerase [Candidatus Brocadiia bacterium]|nr:D-sedoheptulose 7-phosphate isomerase [Planctomycetota bacterium]MBI4008311.1 D-sedoheptulose 7-phosphate isomerase [Planctomycetota bacterium]MDO8093299.1 D-sedoheptulose 7-phosphate isomerase [Candidatus Brocadiales bacterium]